MIHSVGVGYPAINPSELVSLKIWLPPLSEQRTIAAYLDHQTTKIDTLIAKKQRLLELLAEQRAALISRAVTKGLPPSPGRRGAGGEVPMKDSGVAWLGQVPGHWEVKKIKNVAKILRGKFTHRPRNDPSLYDGEYPFIQTGSVSGAGKYITEYQQTLNEKGYAVSAEFPSGTLVMTIAANIGDVAILKFKACFPDSIVGFVPSENIYLDYLYFVLSALKPALMRSAVQNTQLNLNIERIGTLSIVVPPVNEQKQIAEYLDQQTKQISNLTTKIETAIARLREYRAALISAAVTGKI